MQTNPFISKISVKTIFGDVKQLRKLDEGTETVVMSVLGQAHGFKAGETIQADGTPSSWRCLKGIFEATNPETGVVQESTSLYLPNIAMDLIYPMAEQGKSPQFALDIIVVTDNTTQIGYRYSFRFVLRNDDPLAELREAVKLKLATSATNEPVKLVKKSAK